MARLTLRIPEDLHDKLRHIASVTKVSQNEIVLALIREKLGKVRVPRRTKRGPVRHGRIEKLKAAS